MFWQGHGSPVLFIFQFLFSQFSLGSTKCKGNQDLVLRPFWPHVGVWIQASVRAEGSAGAAPANRSELSRRRCWRRDDTWCRSHLHLQNPSDSQRQTGATVEQHNGDTVRFNIASLTIIFRTEALWLFGALNLTSVSRDAAAVLRWSGMSSWVWEWIPAGWSCHSGWRHSEHSVWESTAQCYSLQEWWLNSVTYHSC